MSSDASQSAQCDYCGLPMRGAAQRDGADFCCLGCRIAAAINNERGDSGAIRWTLTRLGLGVFFTLNESVFSMALWTGDVYAQDSASGAMAVTMEALFRYLSLLFALPVFWLLGLPLAANAWRDLRRGNFTADLLLVAGVAASFVYSVANVFRDAGQIYFEVGCVVLTMVTLGRWLEATGKLKTTESLSALEKLLPAATRVWRSEAWTDTPLEQVRPGDMLRVLPGERVPTDGRVVNAVVSVDEQLLTGESRPAIKEPGDTLLGGSLNLDGDLWMKVTAPASAGTLSRLIEAVRTARMRKGRYERLADRVAAWFTPMVTLIAIGTFAGHAAAHGWEIGLMASLAVVLIACPCALGIATPMAVWSALGRASQSQVLFRHGEAIERLAGVRALRFDKTGTLTTGVAQVADLVVDEGESRRELCHVAAALAAGSNHVFSLAVLDYLHALRTTRGVENLECVAGRGLRATLIETRQTALLGSLRFAEAAGMEVSGVVADRVRQALMHGESFTVVGWGDRIRGVFVFREQVRDEARDALRQCRELGLDLAVLTGDHAARGRALARELDIPVSAELLPDAKLAAIAETQRDIGPVAMIGDGVNDAPALAASDVGIALGCGADLTRDTSSICLTSNDLSRLPWAIDLARRTVRVIRQNLFWAFAYNVLGILLAAAGWLNPMWAAGAMVLSSLFVVVNSLRLRGMSATDSTTHTDDQFPAGNANVRSQRPAAEAVA